jgi:hypothetical protein
VSACGGGHRRHRRPALASVAAALTLTLGLPSVVRTQGRFTNATLERRSLSQSLEREMTALAAAGPVWVGYRAATRPGDRQMCCSDAASYGNCCGVCRLDARGGILLNDPAPGPSRPPLVVEPSGEMIVLARLEPGGVARLRVFTPDCEIDGGGLRIVWLDAVPSAASVEWLKSVVGAKGGAEPGSSYVVQPALAALALHLDPTASAALVDLARTGDRREIRGGALFWLAERAGQEAAGTIKAAIDSDPDTDIKRRAVFALSRLPKDQGVPLLVEVARTNRNRAVRRQAMFWLGQSRDPRAVTFFEEILSVR